MTTDLIVPQSLDLMTLGKVLAASGYFQDARDAGQAVVKVLAGQELGLGPISAMTGIYIVKGRVTLSANLIAAAIKRSGRYDYQVTRLDNDACEIQFYQNGAKSGVSTFTTEDAKSAGLAGDNWTKYRRNMLFARAMSNGAKWFCPDVFAGPVYTPDELGAAVNGETGEIIDMVPTMPTPVVEPVKPKPAPTNGDTKPAAATAPARPKLNSASVSNCPGWKLAAVDLVKETGDYYRKNELVDWFHLLGAAHKLGYSEITDANLRDVIAALRDYAAANTEQASADEQAALL